MTTTEAHRYSRTDFGRAEFRAPTVALPRPARNLLMVIDDSRTGAQWVEQVHGSSGADLRQLIAAGLVEPSAAAMAAEHPKVVTLDAALQRWSYDALYTLLTSEARERFGLIRGYRIILQIEGCADLSALRDVARKFVDSVRKSHGPEPAARLSRQLGAS